MPRSAHHTSTGYDIVAVDHPKVVGEEYLPGCWKRIDYIEYNTGISVAPESFIKANRKTVGYLQALPRSSISKYNLMLKNSEAIIDHEFRGTITLRFSYLWQPEDYRYELDKNGMISYGIPNTQRIYKKGDRIAQFVAAWRENISWIQVDSLPETARADGGFGSSGL